MAQAAVKYFGTNIEDMNSSQQFIELLYHDEHNSYAFLDVKSAFGEMRQRACLNKCALLSSSLTTATASPEDKDIWISLNLFTTGKSRTADNCRELTGFYFDLDKHDAPKNKIRQAVSKSTELLYSLIQKKILPMPTIITDTGRGIGVYYIFRQSLAVTRSTEKQQKLYSFLYSKLADIFQYYFNSSSLLEVDRVVVNDRTRIVRLPGSYNTAAGDYCSILNIGEDYFGTVRYYDMSDFKQYVKKFEDECVREVRKEAKSMPVISFVGCTSTFLYNRVAQMIKLQQLFNSACINKRREYMCFIFYNSAKQIYPDAIKRLYDFNENFIVPLNENEIKHVIKSVDSNVTDTYTGYYKLTDTWIVDKLDLTKDELEATLIGQSQRQIQRAAAKELTRTKKQERNSKVIELLEKGSTYADIAKMIKISVSTVKRIAKDNNIKRYYKTEKTEDCCNDEVQIQVATKTVNLNFYPHMCTMFFYVQKVLFLAHSLFVVCLFDVFSSIMFCIDAMDNYSGDVFGYLVLFVLCWRGPPH